MMFQFESATHAGMSIWLSDALLEQAFGPKAGYGEVVALAEFNTSDGKPYTSIIMREHGTFCVLGTVKDIREKLSKE